MNEEPQPQPMSDFAVMMREAVQHLPEHVVIPYDMTPEGQRLTRFRIVCPPEFMRKIDRSQLNTPEAFDRVAKWDGTAPGPLAFGPTGCGKTRAAWSALGRLCVREGKSISFYTTKRLTEVYFEHHMKGDPTWLWRQLASLNAILIDDLDKMELNDRNATMLFEFYDWVYREHRPVITTTNRDRDWWSGKMGTAFCRRLFDEAHTIVSFQ